MMKELSMHILDIARNSVRAKAPDVHITVDEQVKKNRLNISIVDNGPGIDEDILKDIRNPFTTSRTMRKVGLGIPFLDDTCTQCNGQLDITSAKGKGTTVQAQMDYNHIDRPPMGDIASTIAGLMSSNEDMNICYEHRYNQEEFDISTKELKEVLGDVSLADIQVVKWLQNFLEENIDELKTESEKE